MEHFNRAHDRFLLIDDEVYHIGASLKDLGRKWFAFTLMHDITAAELVSRISGSATQESADVLHKNAIAKPAVAQLPGFNFTLPIRHIHWTHNVILMQRVKDIKARYWYMIQCLTSHWSKDFLAEAIKPTNDLIMWYVQNLHKPIVGQEATSSILKLIRKKVGATIQMSQNVRQLR